MVHHFNGPDCSIANLVFAPVDQVNSTLSDREAEAELKIIETYWIRKMCSIQPWGMTYLEIDTDVRKNLLYTYALCRMTLFATPRVAPLILITPTINEKLRVAMHAYSVSVYYTGTRNQLNGLGRSRSK